MITSLELECVLCGTIDGLLELIVYDIYPI